MLEHLTVFSDDTFCFWKIRSLQDLRRAVTQLLQVAQTLEPMHMKINSSKSSVVCLLRKVQRRTRNFSFQLMAPTPSDYAEKPMTF